MYGIMLQTQQKTSRIMLQYIENIKNNVTTGIYLEKIAN